MISGKIGLEGLKAILQHPKLLDKVPYLLETPKHLPQYRAVRRRYKAIQALDDELCRLERDCLRDLLAFQERDWEDGDIRDAWWAEYERRGKAVKRKIGKLIRIKLRSDGAGWLKSVEVTRSRK
jgi:hypothetical protein